MVRNLCAVHKHLCLITRQAAAGLPREGVEPSGWSQPESGRQRARDTLLHLGTNGLQAMHYRHCLCKPVEFGVQAWQGDPPEGSCLEFCSHRSQGSNPISAPY